MPTILLLALAIGPVSQAPANGNQPPAIQVWDARPDGPFQLRKFALFEMGRVQAELKLSAAQKARVATLENEIIEKYQEMQRQGDRQEKARADFLKLREEFEPAVLGLLEPKQKTRLDQIHLQLQGPSAFSLEPLPRLLGLSAQQTWQARAIVAEGVEAMEKASFVPLTFGPGKAPTTLEVVSTFVATTEFRASKEKAWTAVFKSRRETLRRVEETLTDRQRVIYRGLLGEPFAIESIREDLSTSRAGLDNEVILVARQLGIDLGQRADPDFITEVANPAYSDKRHPRVLFDEAHHNFHTITGRYKAFAELISRDGYKVTPNREPFTAKSLAGSDILVIANALGAEGMENPDAAKPAFTDAECDAVRDWVEAGGSLLLVTDLPPFGDAAEAMAKRFEIESSKGITQDPANQAVRGLLFSREKGLIGDQAITRGRSEIERVDRVLTFAGQSLKGPAGSVPFLKFSDTAVDRRNGERVSAAGRSQGIALTRGKGRVVVMGEAGQLSAQITEDQSGQFGMNLPGCDNRQMVLNTLHWLSRLID
jgi:hypothetical protein